MTGRMNTFIKEKKFGLLSLIFIIICVVSFMATASETIQIPDQESLKKILTDFEEYAEQALKDWGIPGMAIAIVQGDQLIYAQGFGVKKLGGSDPVDESTIFQIGSTSKAFTVSLVSMMVDEGKLNWKDKVVDHLPDFRMYDPWVTREFTIEDAMAQHSGMPGYAGDFQAFIGFDRSHIIHSLRYIQPISSFRSGFAYMNNLFLVAAALVEKCTEQSWEENLQKRILDPLGMTSTTFTRVGFVNSSNVAFLHQKLNGQVSVIPMDWQFFDWVYIYGPAGGINSNVIDLAKWLRLQLNDGVFDNKQLISKENIELMHSPHTIINSSQLNGNNYYDLAWVTTDYHPYPLVWHNGGTSGIKALIQLVPQAKLGIVVLTNFASTPLPEDLGKRFVDLYLGNPLRDWSREDLDAVKKADEAAAEVVSPVSPEKPLSLDEYTGSYQNSVYGDVTITRENEKLVLTMGPKKVKTYLLPWNRDTFMLSIPDYQIQASMVVFHLDQNGKVIRMVIDSLNDGNLGTFEREK